MEKSLYFAYGSNINLDQMRYRCTDATVYGQAVLDNYDLRFRGSGVATVEPKEGACVYGLLWELTDQCEASLDRYEGYPRLYICTSVIQMSFALTTALSRTQSRWTRC